MELFEHPYNNTVGHNLKLTNSLSSFSRSWVPWLRVGKQSHGHSTAYLYNRRKSRILSHPDSHDVAPSKNALKPNKTVLGRVPGAYTDRQDFWFCYFSDKVFLFSIPIYTVTHTQCTQTQRRSVWFCVVQHSTDYWSIWSQSNPTARINNSNYKEPQASERQLRCMCAGVRCMCICVCVCRFWGSLFSEAFLTIWFSFPEG